MKIGIDCRMFGLKHAGIGRYVQNLVEELLKQGTVNEYVLFARNREDIKILGDEEARWKIVITDIPHYSLKEQLLLPAIIAKEKVDLMHFPHFNVPVFYKGKYVITIHDLIKHISRGKETTTRASWLYWLKYLGYKYVFNQAVKRAEKIITPSNFVRDEVVKEYDVVKEKVVVTYEAVDDKLKIQNGSQKIETVLNKYKIVPPFLLYVGSVYPHKNIEKLIEAMKIINIDSSAVINKEKSTINHQSPVTLVVVCARSVFWERLKDKIINMDAEKYVNLVGFVPDGELKLLYKKAKAFVFPTLSEGFGLPGLEAMSVGCPVICSNIPVLREIYNDSAIYFDPLNPSEIAGKIKDFLSNEKIKEELTKKGLALVKKYSWSEMARQTMKVYTTSF